MKTLQKIITHYKAKFKKQKDLEKLEFLCKISHSMRQEINAMKCRS